MALLLSGLAVLSGYILGSIPSAYLVGRLKGIDLTAANGDTRLGTRLAFRRLGKTRRLVVAFMDFGKGVLTVAVARVLEVPTEIVLLAGLAAVVGHDWSIFLRFKGGRGAMVSYGVLASLDLTALVLATAVAGVFLLFYRKPTLATALLLLMLAIILWVQSSLDFLPTLPWEPKVSPVLIAFPLTLLLPILIKGFQIQKPRV